MYHPVWAHVPGLVVCVPSNPADAKGLMKTALRAGDPVLMLESKALFASKGEVPLGDHYVPFGVARIARPGRDATIAAAGQMVGLALSAAEALARRGVECEVIDLRTIQPLDVDTVADSVRRTGRLLVVDEGWSMCGVGAELGQAMQELAFDHLDAPVARLHTDAMTHPFAPSLERAMLVNAQRIEAAVDDLVRGLAPAPRRMRGGVSVTAPATVASAAIATTAAAAETAPSATTAPNTDAAAPASAPALPPGEPLTMPFGDLTVSEGTLVRWLKQVGDAVRAGETVVEIETDKAIVEVEAPCDGTLAHQIESEGTVVKMGQQIAIIQPA
jgi:2-oxoisovalerate dehydrogenase E1 component